MWKQIRNTIYEASDLGEIRNSKTLRILKPFINLVGNSIGYMQIGLSENKKRKTYLVHRLIAETFLENYSNDVEVHHINGVRYDNRLVNLRCLSKYENLADRIFGICSIDGIKEIIDLYNNNLSPEQIYSTLREQKKI